MKKPTSYVQNCHTIKAIETHMSWVFLIDEYAYKLKKPIDFPFLNLTTVEERYNNCKTELTVNQPLAEEIYLELIPLIENKAGSLCQVETQQMGNTVDWMIKMKRFPEEKTLEQVIKHKKVSQVLIAKAAKKLVDFYQRAAPVKFCAEAYVTELKQRIQENCKNLILPQYGLDKKLVIEVHKLQLSRLSLLSDAIKERVSNGKIIECHGDLRPEHICLTSPPMIVDRLEFCAELRTMDPVEELSYLAMECEMLGNREVGLYFFKHYKTETKDSPPRALLLFYKSYRASIRAKISAWHLDDTRITHSEKWRQRAREYLDKAGEVLME